MRSTDRWGAFLILSAFKSGIRKAALSNSPVDCCNRRGFSAEKRIPDEAPKMRSTDRWGAFLIFTAPCRR